MPTNGLPSEAEEHRLARERGEAERQRRWEEAMAQAKQQMINHHRTQVLSDRVREWREDTGWVQERRGEPTEER